MPQVIAGNRMLRLPTVHLVPYVLEVLKCNNDKLAAIGGVVAVC